MNFNPRMLRGQVARKKRLNDINKIKKTSEKSGKKPFLIGMKELNKNKEVKKNARWR